MYIVYIYTIYIYIYIYIHITIIDIWIQRLLFFGKVFHQRLCMLKNSYHRFVVLLFWFECRHGFVKLQRKLQPPSEKHPILFSTQTYMFAPFIVIGLEFPWLMCLWNIAHDVSQKSKPTSLALVQAEAINLQLCSLNELHRGTDLIFLSACGVLSIHSCFAPCLRHGWRVAKMRRSAARSGIWRGSIRASHWGLANLNLAVDMHLNIFLFLCTVQTVQTISYVRFSFSVDLIASDVFVCASVNW